MHIPGGNHLDRQRPSALQPRDYIYGSPHGYGHDKHAKFDVPPGGAAQWARVAKIQHQLILRWRDQGGPNGAEMARRYGCSPATWSRTITGTRWAGSLLLAALIEAGLPTTRGERRP